MSLLKKNKSNEEEEVLLQKKEKSCKIKSCQLGTQNCWHQFAQQLTKLPVLKRIFHLEKRFNFQTLEDAAVLTH